MSKPNRVLPWIVGLALTTACDAIDPDSLPETTPVCVATQDGPITGTIAVDTSVLPARADVTFTGTATHVGGVSIRRLYVAGVPATSTGFNFERWEAKVPLTVLRTLAVARTATELASVTVNVNAIDACGAEPHSVTAIIIALSPTPGLDPTTFGFEDSPVYPADQTYLPTTKPGQALVAVVASAPAAGVRVTISPSARAEGLDDDSSVVLQSSGGMARAVFLVDAQGLASGDFILTASAGVATSKAVFTAAGPPTIGPASGSIDAGEGFYLFVAPGPAGIKGISCFARSNGPGVTVNSGDLDLLAEAGGADTNSDGAIDIDIDTVPSIANETKVTVTCRDPFFQEASSTLTINAAQQ